MTVSLKESIPYMIKSLPETKVDADLFKTELLDFLEILSNCGFCIRAIVFDDHPSNVSSFKKLLEHVNQDELYMLLKSRKIYLCYDAVRMTKNVRNNLLKCKRFIFSPFKFFGIKDPVNVPGGEIVWKAYMPI